VCFCFRLVNTPPDVGGRRRPGFVPYMLDFGKLAQVAARCPDVVPVAVHVNCEQNSLLYQVRPKGEGICHTRNRQGKARNCYYRRLDLAAGRLENVDP